MNAKRRDILRESLAVFSSAKLDIEAALDNIPEDFCGPRKCDDIIRPCRKPLRCYGLYRFAYQSHFEEQYEVL